MSTTLPPQGEQHNGCGLTGRNGGALLNWLHVQPGQPSVQVLAVPADLHPLWWFPCVGRVCNILHPCLSMAVRLGKSRYLQGHTLANTLANTWLSNCSTCHLLLLEDFCCTWGQGPAGVCALPAAGGGHRQPARAAERGLLRRVARRREVFLRGDGGGLLSACTVMPDLNSLRAGLPDSVTLAPNGRRQPLHWKR